MSDNRIVVVYFSGYGHTRRQAEMVSKGAGGTLMEISGQGELDEEQWAMLDEATAIIFGSPTYMGMASWQFKRFAEASSKRWFTQAWKDKFFGGFTNSASLNGDKQCTMNYLVTLAMQHGGIWIGLGLLPANSKAATRNDLNNLGASIGAYMQSPSDCSVEEIPQGDLDTALAYGKRIAEVVDRLAD